MSRRVTGGRCPGRPATRLPERPQRRTSVTTSGDPVAGTTTPQDVRTATEDQG